MNTRQIYKTVRIMSAAVMVVLLISVSPLRAGIITFADDYSYPQASDYDYGLTATDIQLSMANPVIGQPLTITAGIHNYGLSYAWSAWGWYSSTGRSCWGEWDFARASSATVDISYRCRDDVTVDWRVELDGVHLGSPSVPGVGSGSHWKTVTVHDVPVGAGAHKLFLGTYQMDYYPDYCLDWVQIGDQRIEAEAYNRMGGNDPNPDWRGLAISPLEVPVQVWDGLPGRRGTMLFQGMVGDTNTVIDWNHQYSGTTWQGHYIKNNGLANVDVPWTPMEAGWHDIYVVTDPSGAFTEINELNNTAHISVWVPEPATIALLGLGAVVLGTRRCR